MDGSWAKEELIMTTGNMLVMSCHSVRVKTTRWRTVAKPACREESLIAQALTWQVELVPPRTERRFFGEMTGLPQSKREP